MELTVKTNTSKTQEWKEMAEFVASRIWDNEFVMVEEKTRIFNLLKTEGQFTICSEGVGISKIYLVYIALFDFLYYSFSFTVILSNPAKGE
jgi:hypothetical protein